MRNQPTEHVHLDEALLIRLQDGELPSREAERARAHLEACWSCRLHAERLAATVLAVAAHHDAVRERLGPPPRQWAGFAARLARQEQQVPRPDWWRRAWSAWLGIAPRPTTATVALAGLVVAWWLFVGETVPVAQAGELLRQARERETLAWAGLARPLVHQRLEVRHGARRGEWDVWRAPRLGQSRSRWRGRDELATQLRRVYERNRLDAEQPLAAAGFVRWRESLAQRSDEVTVDGAAGLMRIRTRGQVAGADAVAEATLTVRRSDLHPVEQTLRVMGADGPQEFAIRELSYVVVPNGTLPLPTVVPTAGGSVETTAPAPAAATVPAPSEADLQWTEAMLRATLHDLKLDTRLSPEIVRVGDVVELRVVTEDGEQKRRLLEALAHLPHLRPDVRQPEDPLPGWRAAAVAAPRVLHRTPPLLGDALAAEFRSADAARDYAGRVHRALRTALVPALALERLAQRYPAAQYALVPAGGQVALDRIAADDLRAVRAAWPEVRGLIEPIVRGLLEQRGQTWPEASTRAAAPSGRESGLHRAARCREVDALFTALFVTHEHTAAGETDADRALTRLAALLDDEN